MKKIAKSFLLCLLLLALAVSCMPVSAMILAGAAEETEIQLGGVQPYEIPYTPNESNHYKVTFDAKITVAPVYLMVVLEGLANGGPFYAGTFLQCNDGQSSIGITEGLGIYQAGGAIAEGSDYLHVEHSYFNGTYEIKINGQTAVAQPLSVFMVGEDGQEPLVAGEVTGIQLITWTYFSTAGEEHWGRATEDVATIKNLTVEEEKKIIRQNISGEKIEVRPIIKAEDIIEARKVVRQVYLDEKIEQYITDIVFATRYPERYDLKDLKDLIGFGGSPRASINLALAARSYAFIKRRGYVIPEDVRAVAHDVLRHRIGLTYEAEATNVTSDEIVSKILNKVEVP